MRQDVIKLRVFIEGVLVPKINTVVVNTQSNEEASALISMPPVPKLVTEELKRARVHIFWSDVEIRNTRSESRWPLLFEGEITGDGYEKGVSSRSLSFNCMGYSTYWQQVLLYFFDLGTRPGSKAPWVEQLSVAVGNAKFGLDTNSVATNRVQQLTTEILKNRDEPYASIVQRVLGDCLQVNYFFQQADEALSLSRRFVSPKDPNLDLLVSRDLFLKAVQEDVLTIFSGEASMLQILKAMLKICRYQMLNNSQPVLIDQGRKIKKTAFDFNRRLKGIQDALQEALEKADIDAGTITSILAKVDGQVSPHDLTALGNQLAEKSTSLTQEQFFAELSTANELIADLGNEARDLGDLEDKDLLSQYLLIPDTRFAAIPSCNVIYPGDQTQLSLQRNLLQEPTRALGVPSQLAKVPLNLFLAPPELQTGAVIPQINVKSVSASGFHPPVIAPSRISSGFGYRSNPQFDKQTQRANKKIKNPGKRRFHYGIDIARPSGATKKSFYGTAVHAFDDGTVVIVGYQGRPTVSNRASYRIGRDGNPIYDNDENLYERVGYGLRIYIKHDNGMVTVYAHLESVDVKRGDRVTRGQKIAAVGSTGTSTGPHLHFETRVGGVKKDPEIYLKQISSQASTEEEPSATLPEEKLEDARGQDILLDYRYLTPEEQITGIVPFFDYDTVRMHSLLPPRGADEEDKKAYQLLIEDHYRQMLNSEYLWQRYSTRSLPALTLPFNPHIVAGFPGLVVDRVRSIIGLVTSVSHSISVGGGQGTASTSVQIEAPRYWDEGDPYFWRGGEEKTKTVDGRETPDSEYANFPTYYLPSLIPENSTARDDWGSRIPTKNPRKKTKADRLYEQILGAGVRAIPYQYATRPTNRNTAVVYNKAIDGRDTDHDYPNTIVGNYYRLKTADPDLADTFVRKTTSRLGADEYEMMVLVLGSSTQDGGRRYTGRAFRDGYQKLVSEINRRLNEKRGFRG